jgi:hypothetical protein
MRAYFFGDIHGNSYALEVCLQHIDRLKPDQVYCMGDLTGWLPFGDRTLTRVRSLGLPTVAGNHDLLVAGLMTDHPEQKDRIQATAYNAGLLSTIRDAVDYLLDLPLILEREDLVVVHHSPFHLPSPGMAPTIDHFNYLDDCALALTLEAWRSYPKRIIFSGHDNTPTVYELPDAISSPALSDIIVHRPGRRHSLTIQLNPRSRYWVKGGSIGGPYRDGVVAANPVLYDRRSQTITLFRLPFPTDELRRELASHRFCLNLPTLQRYLELLS